MSFSQEQILNLAPDEASKKAGQQLANSAKWVVKFCHEKALWGDCQGSGSKPYKTMIDLKNLAFKCSCPSRKFPCKHGLGLFLLFTNQDNVFVKANEMEEQVAEWITKRDAKAEAKDQPKEEKPIDEKAQQKRIDSREKKIEGGIEELSNWLKDIVRNGIMLVPQNPYQFNRNIITRMVDAQANGLANQLRKINTINFYEEGWQLQLTKQLAGIFFLCEAYKNKNSFDELWQREINSQIGWTITKEEVLLQNATHDDWFIVSKVMEEEGNLTTEKIYLFGLKSNQFACLLNFYAGNQLPQHLYTTGNILEADICFYPGVNSIRAIVKQQHHIKLEFREIQGFILFESILEQISEQLAINPLIKSIPFIISTIKILFDESGWFLKDKSDFIFSLKNSDEECWNILSISKANSFSCFVVYEELKLQVHSVWLNGKFYFVK
jgi:hypothetical protein